MSVGTAKFLVLSVGLLTQSFVFASHCTEDARSRDRDSRSRCSVKTEILPLSEVGPEEQQEAQDFVEANKERLRNLSKAEILNVQKSFEGEIRQDMGNIGTGLFAVLVASAIRSSDAQYLPIANGLLAQALKDRDEDLEHAARLKLSNIAHRRTLTAVVILGGAAFGIYSMKQMNETAKSAQSFYKELQAAGNAEVMTHSAEDSE